MSTTLRHSSSRQRGFSLIEVILVLVLVGTVIGVAAQPIANTMRAIGTTRSSVDLRGELDSAAARMTRAIRGAQSVTCPDAETLRVVVQIQGSGNETRAYATEGTPARLVLEREGATGQTTVLGGGEKAVTRFSCENGVYNVNSLTRVAITLETTATTGDDASASVEVLAHNR